MGGSSKGPPTPDYMPLFNAFVQNMQHAMDLSERQWTELTRLQTKYEPVWDDVIDFSVDRMERLDKWAQDDRARYMKVFAPVEDKLAKDAMEYAQPWRKELEAGKAEADIAQQFEQSRQAAMQNLERYGVDPSQTRAAALDSQSRVVEAAAQSAAGNVARDRVDAMARQLQGMAVQAGRGVVSQGQANEQLAASSAGQAASTGMAGIGTVASAKGKPTEWFQLGTQSGKAGADLMSDIYRSDIEKYKAEQAADKGSGIGSIIGKIAGMGFSAWSGGGFESARGGTVPRSYAEGGAIPDPAYQLGGATGDMMMPGQPQQPAAPPADWPTGGDVSTPGGGVVPYEMSPSAGAIPDDVPAQVSDGGTANLSPGEFVIPQDVMSWKGQEWAQKEIMKARKSMGDPNQAPAQPTMPPMSGGIPAPNQMPMG